MSVTTDTNSNFYIANGTQLVFDVAFRFLNEAHLEVIVAVNGVETTKVLNVDYTVTGANDYSGGTIVFTESSKPSYLSRVSIRRVMPLTQPLDLRNQGAFFAETHEDAFDALTMMIQQLKSDVERGLKLPVTATEAGDSLELPAPQKGYVVGWNDTENGLTNYSIGNLFDGQAVIGGYYGSNGQAVPEVEGLTLTGGTY